MRHEDHDLHGTGQERCEVYDMPIFDRNNFWTSVTDVPCPVEGCDQVVVWWEAAYVPGYRVCLASIGGGDGYDAESLRHRFLAKGTGRRPELVRDKGYE